ncbi:MepB family protein [Microvirga terricola]|uniref:MepB family protein n=1 Tax=Microvirga terricola TaxID=2719797 RepID=A0ABX0V8V1_9HYPH|nr:MepB family protein [Microvirga terricola]NIX75993.1 MepB family protein [Microvirga terricola]
MKDTLPQDLLAAIALVYEPNGFSCSPPRAEPESLDYGACAIELSGRALWFRVSKITPTKIGQFVTLWKRSGQGPIQPFDTSDPIDLFVISCRQDQRLGQFVFPKSVLCERDIVSRDGKGGKRGMRVYPPWDRPTNRQALKTQHWQLDYFLHIAGDRPLDHARARTLYGLAT